MPLHFASGWADDGRSPRKKSERTRQAILDSALAFLWDHPFRDLNVAQLMTLAGSSRPAFYQYFADLHDLMRTLLDGMRDDIMAAAAPWLESEGDPVPLLQATLSRFVTVCYQRGPILRAVVDAASSDKDLEQAWTGFMQTFDDAVARRIEYDQAEGLIPPFPARPVAVALNRLDASMVIEHFGQRPPGNPEAVTQALTRIWISTLYGREALP